MRAEDLLLWVRAVPFVPFRLRLSCGRTYDIRHPEMLRVGRTSMIIFSFVGDPLDPYERGEKVSPLLVEAIEPLDVTQPA